MKGSRILHWLPMGVPAGIALLGGVVCVAAWGQSGTVNPAVLQPHTMETAVVVPNRSALLQLRQILEFAATAPLISNVSSGGTTSVSPGQSIIVNGQEFESSDGRPGQIVLNLVPYSNPLLNRYDPGQTSAQTVSYPLEIPPGGWTKPVIAATIPNTIAGVVDQQATILVVRSDGGKSNPVTVQFQALLDLAVLPQSDVQVICSPASDVNECNNNTIYPLQELSINHSSVATAHIVFVSGQTHGVDTYRFHLKNGWEADTNAIRDEYDEPSDGYDGSTVGSDWMYDFPQQPISLQCCATATGPDGLPTAASFDVKFACDMQEAYGFNIYIRGPKGVPWK